MVRRRIEIASIKALYLCALGVLVAQSVGAEGVVSLLFAVSLILTLVAWGLGAARSLSKKDALLIAMAFLAFASVVVNAFLTSTDVSASYFKKYILFIVSIVFLRVASDFKADRATKRFIFCCIWASIAVMVALYFLDYSRAHVYKGIEVEYLVLCFSNPNLAALFLACFYMFSLAVFVTAKRFFGRVVALISAGFMLYFLIETESRNSLLAVGVFTSLYVVYALFQRKSHRISKVLATVFTVYPFVFFCLYMIFIDSAGVKALFSSFVDVGKGLDSRLAVWHPALDYFFSSPAIGAYSQISEGTGASQLHNTHLDVMASYGLFVLVLLCVFLRLLFGRSEGNEGKWVFELAFACVIALGAGEAALFSGGLVFYVYAGLFLLLRDGASEKTLADLDRTGESDEDRIHQ